MNIMGELAIIFGLCLAAEGISALLPITMPASVISLLLLLICLLTGLIKERQIHRAGDFFIRNMAFFFVPPVWDCSNTCPPWPPAWSPSSSSPCSPPR